MQHVTGVWRGIYAFSRKYPLSRGIASYAIIWPVGCIVQQSLEGRERYDYARIARFSIYGALYVAPTLHAWMNIARVFWPKFNFASGFTKALVEQVTYTPFAMSSFYFFMTLLEGKTVPEADLELRTKFLSTYKVAVVIWPILQTINYTVVRERNRVAYVSVCSLFWTIFLSYMKHLEHHHFDEPDPNNPEKLTWHPEFLNAIYAYLNLN